MFCAGALREAAYVVCADAVATLVVPAPMLLRRISPDKVRQSINRFAVFVPLPPHPDALCPVVWRFGRARAAIARVGHLSSCYMGWFGSVWDETVPVTATLSDEMRA